MTARPVPRRRAAAPATLLLGLASLSAVLLLPPLAPAQAQASDPAAQALIDRLRPVAGGSTRGIRVPGDHAPAPSATTAPAPIWATPASATTGPRPAAAPHHAPLENVRPLAAAPRPPAPPRDTTADAPSVSITVTFPTGSATLTPEAERALAPLGRALASDELAPYRFRIEGHTDTVGDTALNQALSERRAAAVRDHLARTYGVNAERLIAVGFGSSQLLVTTPPQTPEARNRRVQVVNLGN